MTGDDDDDRYDVAECERRVAACEAEQGPTHLNTARALYDLTLALWPLQRYEEAIAHARRALQIGLAQDDSDWWFVRSVRGALGKLLSIVGHADEALRLLRHEAAVADRRGRPGDRFVTRWFLGEALLRAQQWSEAIECFEIALPIAEAKNNQRQVEALRGYIAEARARRGDA